MILLSVLAEESGIDVILQAGLYGRDAWGAVDVERQLLDSILIFIYSFFYFLLFSRTIMPRPCIYNVFF